MLPATLEHVEALNGSRGVETLAVSAWYDGHPTVSHLPVESWTLTADASRAIHSTLRVRVADPDGDLSPWSLTDPLGVAGQELRAVYQWGLPGQGGYRQIQRGIFPIVRAEPNDRFVNYAGEGYPARWVPAGSTISLTCEDLTEGANVSFPGVEAPRPGVTRLGEVRRILSGIVPVRVDPAVRDASAGVEAYTGTRLAAVLDHLDALGATHRVETDGMMYVYPVGPRPPVWTVRHGHDGALVDAARTFEKADLVNIGVAESSGGDREIVGRAPITDGPLRWGGPLGYRPRRHASPLYTTQTAANRGATTVLANARLRRSTLLKVTCLPNPYVELGDWWTVGLPTPWGEVIVVGEVVAYTLSGGPGGVAAMTADVRVSDLEMSAAVEGVRE